MKDFLIALSIAFITVLVIFFMFLILKITVDESIKQQAEYIEISELETEDLFKKCIDAGGEYQVYDWSLRDNGGDYRATCEIPERRLWQYKIKI